jgi:hypothetical protein
MPWLRKLGSNVHLLRKLQIDFETIFLWKKTFSWKKKTFSWRKCRAVPGIFIRLGLSYTLYGDTTFVLIFRGAAHRQDPGFCDKP